MRQERFAVHSQTLEERFRVAVAAVVEAEAAGVRVAKWQAIFLIP